MSAYSLGSDSPRWWWPPAAAGAAGAAAVGALLLLTVTSTTPDLVAPEAPNAPVGTVADPWATTTGHGGTGRCFALRPGVGFRDLQPSCGQPSSGWVGVRRTHLEVGP